ncbi:MAG: hypothetical protein ACRDHW_02760 [Ktedonobacteraceae bacterium]
MNTEEKRLIDLALSLPDEQADRVMDYMIEILPSTIPVIAAERDPQKSTKLQYALIEESLNPPMRDGKIYSTALEAWLKENHRTLTPLGDHMVLVPESIHLVEVQATGKIYYRDVHNPSDQQAQEGDAGNDRNS